MGFFNKLFGNNAKNAEKELAVEENKDSGYEDIPGFIETDPTTQVSTSLSLLLLLP